LRGSGAVESPGADASSKADLALYTSSPQQQDLSPTQQLATPEIAQAAEKQHVISALASNLSTDRR